MYTIRAARPEDAEAIVGLVSATYGDSYPHPEFYDPAEVRAMQAEGSLVSLVAVEDESGTVVGHYALKRPDGTFCSAETAAAMVSQQHRGAKLMDRMREVLEQKASELGLLGIYGTPVTSHPFSQKTYDRRHNTPTGLLLGNEQISLAGFHERRTENALAYFKYLTPPEPQELLVPAELQALAREIYADLGAPVTLREPSGNDAKVDPIPLSETSTLLLFPGDDPFPESSDAATYLDLPLKEDGWGELYARARRQGFRFAAFLPMREHGDRLILQFYPGDLSALEPAINHPLGRKIWEFIRR